MSPQITAVFLAALLFAAPAHAAISRTDAERAAAGVRAALARDRGKLWGIALDGPLLFVDPGTREIVATAADTAGRLKPEGSLFAGTLPTEINVANTALDWGGRRWSMVMWPIPADELRQRVLLIHELWHRVQDQLRLPATGPSNAHLDTPEGRLWLQLEWRALAAALENSGRERREAIADALAFRAMRRARFAAAAGEERALERHEGLAEYTGVRLAHPTRDGARGYAQVAISTSNVLETFVRSFAYVSGPAYGLLLDDARPKWRRELQGGADLGGLLRDALRLAPSDTGLARERGERYGLTAIAAAEGERERRRQEKLADLHRRFVNGPVLRLPLRSPKLSFDPRGLQPLDSLGTVYPGLRITESWGILDAPGGGLISTDWTAVTIPAPASADTMSGPGWRLALDAGWMLAPAPRAGSFQLSEKK